MESKPSTTHERKNTGEINMFAPKTWSAGVAILIAVSLLIPITAVQANTSSTQWSVDSRTGPSRLIPQIASGVALDTNGRGTTSVVVLYALRFIQGGARFEEIMRQKTNSLGRFSLHSTMPSGMESLAHSNSGYLNLALSVINNGRISTTMFSRKQTARGWIGGRQDSKSLRVQASRKLEGTARQRASQLISQTSLSAMRPMSYTPVWCNYSLMKTSHHTTVVGELNTYSGLEATFTYGQGNTADSDISVAFKNGSNWSLEGSIHVGNSDGSTISRTRNTGYYQTLGSSFTYGKFQKTAVYPADCWFATEKFIAAMRWNTRLTEVSNTSYMNWQCHNLPYKKYRLVLQPGDGFTRDNSTLQKITVAVKAFGVGLSATSGASKQVGYKYHVPLYGSPKVLCGNNDSVNRSGRILVGD